MNNVKPLTDDQINKFRVELQKYDRKYSIMFEIGINTGLRISDILNLRAKDIRNRPFTIIETKTKKSREINFPDNLHNRVINFLKDKGLRDNQYIIFSRDFCRHKPLSRVQAYKVMKKISNDLKIDFIGTHTLRKTYAVKHYKKNRDMKQLQRELNHRDLSTTILYVLGVSGINDINI